MTETTDWKILSAAHDALRTAVAGVPDDAWALPTPCADWSVTQVLQHAAGDQLLRHALARLLLSARAYHRVLRVARTIADLAGHGSIAGEHRPRSSNSR